MSVRTPYYGLSGTYLFSSNKYLNFDLIQTIELVGKCAISFGVMEFHISDVVGPLKVSLPQITV